MSQFYQIVTFGAPPVSLVEMKAYLKLSSTSQDVTIQALINACTAWGESYTGREFRENVWDLLIDCFSSRIEIRRNPVKTIDEVSHTVGGSSAVVPADVYYLKHGVFSSEVLLVTGKDWPVDTDDREQAIKIRFTTEAYYRIDDIKIAIMRHVAAMFFCRGDCCGEGDTALAAGVTDIYDLFKILRT